MKKYMITVCFFISLCASENRQNEREIAISDVNVKKLYEIMNEHAGQLERFHNHVNAVFASVNERLMCLEYVVAKLKIHNKKNFHSINNLYEGNRKLSNNCTKELSDIQNYILAFEKDMNEKYHDLENKINTLLEKNQ